MGVITDADKINKLFERYVQTVYPSLEEAKKKLGEGKQLSFYLGIDPTGPDIHLGHSTNFLWLKQLIQLGHKAILLIGDFTARIGDPTGKESTRKALSEKEINKNMATYLEQVYRILPQDAVEVKYNSTWLAKLNFGDLIQLASNLTVQQMIVRDMFQERIKQEKPIYLHEFLYPLAQGYDSVAMEVDGELGGNDQTFNMLVGRDLEKSLLQKDKLVVTTKLLEDPVTRKKVMNKSEGNVISLNDEPQEIRRKILSLDDKIIPTIFELCTEKDMEWVKAQTENPRELKEALAEELIRMYHGEESIQAASAPKEIQWPEGKSLAEGIVIIGGASSIGAAKKLIDQGAVKVNREVVDDWETPIPDGAELQVGKGKFYRIKKN